MSEQNVTPEDLAKQKVDALIGFKVHFMVYAGVNLLLLIINVVLLKTTGPKGETLPFFAYFWCIWPIVCWGLGLLLHYIALRKFCGTDFEQWKANQQQKPQPGQENK